MKIPFPKPLLALATLSLSLQYADAITTTEQLKAWKSEVQREEGSISSKFKLQAARKNQKQAFINGGVGWAQRYTSAWGGWIYMDWSSARNLHTRLARQLNSTIVANRPSDPVSEATMIKYRTAMQDFRWRNGKIRRLLHTRLQLNVYRGREADTSHDYHLKANAARIAGAKLTAKALEAKAKYHAKRADQWARIGGQTSAMIRQLGGTQPVNPTKFTQAYQGMLGLAKSGELPSENPATGKAGE